MRDETGCRIALWSASRARRRHCQLLPRFGERWVTVRRGQWDFGLVWKKWFGYAWGAFRAVVDHGDPLAWEMHNGRPSVPIKKPAFDPATLVPPDLPSESKVLHKFAALRTFLCARSYEGGGVRAPGKLWLETTASGFQITLIDVDLALRVSGRANTLDEVLALGELLAGGEGVAWEVDAFLAEKAAKKKKK